MDNPLFLAQIEYRFYALAGIPATPLAKHIISYDMFDIYPMGVAEGEKLFNKMDRFESLKEFFNLIDGLDEYASLPANAVFGERTISNENVRVIANVTKNHLCMAVGKNYPVFGHREALTFVAREIEKTSTDVHGSLQTVGDRTYTRILFKGVDVLDAKDSKVELGVSFENPMDKKTTFRGYGYTFRQTCSNGAGLKTMLPNMEITEAHTRDMMTRVPPVIHDFIERSLRQTNHLQTLIDNATKEKIVFESREQLKDTMLFLFDGISPRHIKRITDEVQTLTPTRWDLFNASNYVTSHYAVSPDVRSDIDKIAESFINQARRIDPVVNYHREDGLDI